MIKTAWGVAVLLGALVIVAVAEPLLFWLGRANPLPRGEMVVDLDDIDHDDPGMDVDGDPQ